MSRIELEARGWSLLLPEDQYWRPSHLMQIPNSNLLEQLGTEGQLSGRLWRLPPHSANTRHKHVDQWELFLVLEGTGRIRLADESVTVPKYGSLLVAPHIMRQVFNDTPEEVLWLIIGAPADGYDGKVLEQSDFYPEDPTQLPPELKGHVWPPK